MEAARAAGIDLRAGRDSGILHGIPYAVIGLFNVKGLPTTAGSSLLEKNTAAAHSQAVRKLTQAGMILLGKTNTIQFAYGVVGTNYDHGTPHNPWHQIPYVPGGSSSGSAVAVAAGKVPMALGTDTGGSGPYSFFPVGYGGLEEHGRAHRPFGCVSFSELEPGFGSRFVQNRGRCRSCLPGLARRRLGG